jgi:hypothetical protein
MYRPARRARWVQSMKARASSSVAGAGDMNSSTFADDSIWTSDAASLG